MEQTFFLPRVVTCATTTEVKTSGQVNLSYVCSLKLQGMYKPTSEELRDPNDVHDPCLSFGVRMLSSMTSTLYEYETSSDANACYANGPQARILHVATASRGRAARLCHDLILRNTSRKF
jgi:hypothetical protein